MGVPFNFTCSGVGTYSCTRCGEVLFDSEDRIPISAPADTTPPPSPYYWPRFTKAITPESVMRVALSGQEQQQQQGGSSSSSDELKFQIACGKCGVKLGYEHVSNKPGGGSTGTGGAGGGGGSGQATLTHVFHCEARMIVINKNKQ